MHADEHGLKPVLLSSSQPASVDDEYVAVNVIAGARGEEDGGAGDVFRIAPAARRNSFENLSVARFVSLKRGGVGRAHVARGDCVDVDSVFGPFICKCFRELRDAAF